MTMSVSELVNERNEKKWFPYYLNVWGGAIMYLGNRSHDLTISTFRYDYTLANENMTETR